MLAKVSDRNPSQARRCGLDSTSFKREVWREGDLPKKEPRRTSAQTVGTLLGALANLTADALEVAEESGAKLGTHAAMLEEAALDLFDELAQ